MRVTLILTTLILLLGSCSVQQQIAKSAKADVLDNKALQAAHVGISLFDPAAGKYLYNYQGDKYFVPASNTKIPTCYAAMKYLGDSLVGMRYGIPEEKYFKDNVVVIKPAGDPTFLLDEYNYQPVFQFLKEASEKKEKFGFYVDSVSIERWGNGWSWNDYEAAYMAERNEFPVFGNVVKVQLNRGFDQTKSPRYKQRYLKSIPYYFDSVVNDAWNRGFWNEKKFEVKRNISANTFFLEKSGSNFGTQVIPFVTNGYRTVVDILKDTLKKPFTWVMYGGAANTYSWDEEDADATFITVKKWHTIHSQPTDSLLKPMMHRSDNFFAEQSLLMVSNEKLGLMSDEKIIDTLLKTDFKDLPQAPRWADGSGLSRYNLFTPQDFVAILHKMKNEFGMERIKVVFPTGGEGTISNYYRDMSGAVYGKTGTLSGVVAFSGYLYTKKGKLLIFSTLVNNHRGSATDIRRAVEKFLRGIWMKY